MRKLMFGLLGFAALGFGALSVQTAEAQPYYRGYGYSGPAPVVTVQYGRPYYGRRYYGRPYRAYRPVRTVRRCWVEPRRIWNGYRWVRRPIEVCRTVRRPGYRW
jgi:hypothetical protein